MRKKIRVAIAESNVLLKQSLVSLLQTNTDFDVTGAVQNGKELLDHIKQKEVDLVIINSDMPFMSGKETLNVLQMRFPAVKAIVLGSQEGHNLTTDFMSIGARGYLTLNCEVETLFEAMHAVYSEGHYFDSSISKAMLGSLIKNKSAHHINDIEFSDRETDIMKEICDGKTNKEIASTLHLSASTVDFYKGRIYEKIDSNNVTDLVKFALRKGIVALI